MVGSPPFVLLLIIGSVVIGRYLLTAPGRLDQPDFKKPTNEGKICQKVNKKWSQCL
jgi:hypothetical protein